MATKAKKASKNGHSEIAPRFTDEQLVDQQQEKGEGLRVAIQPLRERVAEFRIRSCSPLMMGRFSGTKFEQMQEAQQAGSQKGSKKVRKPRDFAADCEGAKHVSREGWYGLPCAAFRRGLIETCRMCGFKMTIGKMAIFVEADGYEASSNDPLVRIQCDEPVMDLRPARNANGSCDIRARPLFKSWSAVIRIRFDEDQFSLVDVSNLLHRMGRQNGIGEGRPNSRSSAGMGFGTFELVME